MHEKRDGTLRVIESVIMALPQKKSSLLPCSTNKISSSYCLEFEVLTECMQRIVNDTMYIRRAQKKKRYCGGDTLRAQFTRMK